MRQRLHDLVRWLCFIAFPPALVGCPGDGKPELPPVCARAERAAARGPEGVVELIRSSAEQFRLPLRGMLAHPPRSANDSLMVERVDAAADSLWNINPQSQWVFAFLIANGDAAGIDVAVNASKAYRRHRAPAFPLLKMMNDYTLSADRLNTGVRALTALQTTQDTLLLARLYCGALNERDILAASRSQWWGGNQYELRIWQLEGAMEPAGQLLGLPAWSDQAK